MADALKGRFEDVDVELVRSSGGVFEVTVDDRLVFSKKAAGRHATPDEVIAAIESGRE